MTKKGRTFLTAFAGSIGIIGIALILSLSNGVDKYIEKVNSLIGLRGIIKKFGYFIVVGVAVVLDRIMGDTGAIRTLVIYFFIANDGISILENWGGMGLPLPQKLFDVLEQLKNDNDSKENEEVE